MDTHSITTVDITGDIITAIDIQDITTLNQHTRGITCRVVSSVDRLCRDGHLGGIHIGHTTATKDILNLQSIGIVRGNR